MRFTDLFIKRPVLASVISLLIMLLGFKAYNSLPIREYPELEDSVIEITTSYSGASAELIQGFITTPIQQAIASAEGIDYIKSTSQQGSSDIQVHLKLGYDANSALTEIMSKVAQVRNELPVQAESPVISKESGRGTSLMYISFFSKTMNDEQITDYLTRMVQPKLTTIEGVAEAQILGKKTYAMRVWLNPARMAAFGVTNGDINTALEDNNFQSAAGQVKGSLVVTNVKADTDLHDTSAFENIVVKSEGDTLVRLKDVARVELGAENYNSFVSFNGIPSVYIGITSTPSANPLDVIKRVRAEIPQIQQQLPEALNAQIVHDATEYIHASIQEVVKTLSEATIIVIFVVFLFLGAFRSVIIPVVTIPLSMIGVLFFMLAMGYSINLLTLLAMVLAIGLVVDDAIVVVENIHRHIEEGHSPFKSALIGAREIAMPVISMTITLAAVYAPIGFLGGLTGTLFREFAFTLAGAVIISGVIALTLSPMMCSKLLRPDRPSGFSEWLDQHFERLRVNYKGLLNRSLAYRPVTLVFAFTVLISIPFLFMMTKSELAPTEDQGILFISAEAPQYANIDYLNKYTQQFQSIFKSFPEYERSFEINGMGNEQSAIAGFALKPWDQRERTQMEIQPLLQKKLNTIAGLQVFSFNLPSLPGTGGGMPIEFILNTTESYQSLYQVAEKLTEAAKKSGLFMTISNSLKFNNPEINLNINRNKAGQLGVSMADIGNALSSMLSEGYVNRFSIEGRSYEVIPQVPRAFRFNAQSLKEYYVRSKSGALIPLSTLVTIHHTVTPNSLTQFQQLNSATIQGIMMPCVSQSEALGFLQTKVKELAPKGFGVDYEGGLRLFVQEGNTLLYTFGFSLIVIFLVLAAQFESFRDPLIILISVPMSICGALIPLTLGAATMNIYTQVGLVTLIGLISKHGILIVEFANQLQREKGLSIREAAIESASIRLRPILMTTAAMVLGVIPLLVATGAGAVSRFDIGLVISTGMTIGTLFTLFVLPMFYTLLARQHRPEENEALLTQEA